MSQAEIIDQGEIASQLLDRSGSADFVLKMVKRERLQFWASMRRSITEIDYVPTAFDAKHPDGIHMDDWLRGIVEMSGGNVDNYWLDFGAVTLIAMDKMERA